jgi:hypothetical protein
MSKEKMEAKFQLDEDTKNTRRFEEVTEVKQGDETMKVPAEGLDQHSIGTLYIQQEKLQDAFGELPDQVEVEVTVSDDG